jgi:signal transduction histidine kinase
MRSRFDAAQTSQKIPTASAKKNESGSWDRRRVGPRGRQLAIFAALVMIGALVFKLWSVNPFVDLVAETLLFGMGVVFAPTLAGIWHQKLLPRRLAQVLAVVIGAVLAPLTMKLLSVGGAPSVFFDSVPMVRGYVMVTMGGAIIGTLFALGALYRDRDAHARAEALQFALERETLERQAAIARLQLLTAQIEPHFLLNTLANVQELVESGSPRAVPMFRSLITYLQSAVPHLRREEATLGDEERLLRSYLELMFMRMPDRLTVSVDIDATLRNLRFPPMALLTLVENAIRHGIDPCCDGGAIAVGACRLDANTVHIWVADTGVGMSESAGMGTGLTNLKDRLQALFGASASLELTEQTPHGLRADMRLMMPA